MRTSLRHQLSLVLWVIGPFLCLGVSPTPAQASPVVQFDLAVSPARPSTTDALVATLSGTGFNPDVTAIEIGDGTVDLLFEDILPPILPPGPADFTIHRLIQPLPAGFWEVRLVDATSSSLPILDSQFLIVADFGIELTPTAPTRDDRVTARLTGWRICSFFDPVVVEPGRIRIGMTQFPVCDPPVNTGPFDETVDLGRLPPGDYVVEFVLSAHPRDILLAETALQVTPIGACQPRHDTLCLTGGRFKVRAFWYTESGDTGEAIAVSQTPDTGLFWFFNDRNLELMVKVLDACDTVFNSFWVFAGGLTDVGVSLVVTDTETGEQAFYENLPGERFATVTDTAAFRTCP
ncbi:MAG: hypothetical protein AAF657_21605 [Acidobacteriota bacterium]